MRPLLIYIEPTPYILDLVARLRDLCPSLHVCFISTNLTQNWDLAIDGAGIELLPLRPHGARARIRQLLRSRQYGVVHLAGWGHPTLAAALAYAWLFGIPAVVESDTPRPPSIGTLKAIFKRVFYPQLFKLPSLFLPGGTRQAVYLRDFGVPDRKIRIAQMTVDTLAISRHVDALGRLAQIAVRGRYGIPADAVVALYVGRLEPHKGVSCLLEAFATSSEKCSNLWLAIVGEGTLLGHVQQVASEDSRIVSTGRLSGSNLLDAYAMADFLVVPSLFEPWGLVVNEGMAAGLPTIVSDRVGCADDLVKIDKTGIIVAAGDSNAMARAMIDLSSDQRLREQLAAGARTLISHWTLEEEASRVCAAWNEVCSV